MSKRRSTPTKLAPKPVSAPPDLPTVDIEIGGVIYKACFDFQALYDAEEQLLRLGHKDANLLRIFPQLSASSARRLFAVAIQRFHPQIPFDERVRLVGTDPRAIWLVGEKLAELWLYSMPKPKEGAAATGVDPSQASAVPNAGD